MRDSLTVINKEQSEQITKIKEQLESTEKVKNLSFWDNAQIWLGRILGAILILKIAFELSWIVFRMRKSKSKFS